MKGTGRLIGGITHKMWDAVSRSLEDDAVLEERIDLFLQADEGAERPVAQLPIDNPARIEPAAAQPVTDQIPNQPQRVRVEWAKKYKGIYHLLGVLNEKAEALMVYSGVTLAVVGVANIRKDEANDPLNSHYYISSLMTKHDLAITIAVIMLLSILFSLVVVGIFWTFMEKAVPRHGADPARDYQHEWKELTKVLVLRQRCYQAAWLLAILAWLLLLIFVIRFGV